MFVEISLMAVSEQPVADNRPETVRRSSLLDRGFASAKKYPWFLLFVVLPTLLAAVYYFVIASDIYVSESRFVIKAPNQKQGQLSTIASLIQTTGLSAGQEQTNEILEYVRSRDALADVSRQIDVRAIFKSSESDLLSGFPGPFGRDRFETLYKYYTKMVQAGLDKETGTATLKVKAFTANDAYMLNARLLDLSEALVNRLNARAQGRAVSEAEKRVADAQSRLRTARVALREYRNDQALLDPGKQAAGVLDISNRLVAEQAALTAQLQSIQQAAPRHPAIQALRQRIAAIARQAGAQNGRAVGTDTGIASKLSQYENLAVEQEFATQMLTAAGASLEQARIEAQKQQFYLERIVEPDRPDTALLPARLTRVIVVLAAALCPYLIGWMLVVGILEHSPDA